MTLSSYWNFVSRTPISPSKTFEWVEGVAMGSPVSPIVANLYMEYLEQKALSTAPHPPSSGAGLWMTPLSSIRKSINMTSYNTLTVLTLLLGSQWSTTRRMGPFPSWTPLLNQRLMVAYPSLCTGNLLIQTITYSGIATTACLPNLVSLTPSLTGTKQCAAILSCSNRKRNTSQKLSQNASIINGLWTRSRKDLSGLPVRLLMGLTTRVPQVPLLPLEKLRVRVTLSYPTTQGLCESIKKICGRYGIKTHFKGGSTIKNLLVSPKDKDPMVNQSDVIYWYQCGDLTCDDEYIGETSRTFGERYKEHLKDPSPIHHHNNQTNHPFNHKNFKIIGREGHHLSRYIKESIFIRVNNPNLNNDVGKFNLPHMWDRVLINTPGLKLNK